MILEIERFEFVAQRKFRSPIEGKDSEYDSAKTERTHLPQWVYLNSISVEIFVDVTAKFGSL